VHTKGTAMNRNWEAITHSIEQLITETATNLPQDVREAIEKASMREHAGTRAALSLSVIGQNIDFAEQAVAPICQDTGMPTFWVHVPECEHHKHWKEAIHNAVVAATSKGVLRTNTVDSLTGENSGNNIGIGTPVIHIAHWERDEAHVVLLLKGGGCENKNAQYSLPCTLPGLGLAGRDIDGVRKCILHAVYEAQGQGCSAGFIGVGIGGDRTTGYALAKRQLLERVDVPNEDPMLAELERVVMDSANALGIGTMGFGGEATLLGVRVGVAHRLPASFFVSIAYNCWAFRRQGIALDGDGAIASWLYPRGRSAQRDVQRTPMIQKGSGRVVALRTPLTEQDVRGLRVGDVVVLSGSLYTGRDAVHKLLMNTVPPVDLHGGALYHCGPVVMKDGDTYSIKAAGPTTSMREEPYQAHILRTYGVRAVIGKGGMGKNTLDAMREVGAVYCNAIGGAAQVYANTVRRVVDVHWGHLGIPEAMWHLDVADFAAVVTMDAWGNSLHEDIERSSFEKLSKYAERVFS
jgi:fumarate hydratase class I